MSRIFPKAVAMVLGFAVAYLLLLEVPMQIYTRLVIQYDVEMARYAAQIKVKSENAKIGHVHRPNVDVRLMGVDVRINSDGLRDDEIPVETTDRYRIVALGDSLTFGWGVEKPDTFVDLLEKELGRLRPVDFINFGTGNYNTEQQVNLLFEKGEKYSPDLVVVFYFINDAQITPVRSGWHWLSASRSLTLLWARLRALTGRLDSSATYASTYRSLYIDGQAGWQAAQRAFIELREYCVERGVALRVVILPELHDLIDYPFMKEHEKVETFLEAQGIPTLDLTPHFLGERDPKRLWVAPDDAHPNREGHRMIAEYSSGFIARGMQHDG